MSVCLSSHRVDQSESSDYYCIFLHIVEGVGFNPKTSNSDFHHDKVLLNASLNNIKFEVEGYSLSNESATIFNNFCVWECQLKDIKRMKTDNRPVKIECFYKSADKQFSGSKAIGTLLLPVRGLQPIQSIRNVKLKINWHKLGTLSTEWRSTKPEICLMMVIAKKHIVESGELENLIREGRKSGTSKLFSPGRSETAFMLQSQNNVYVQLLEQLGAIQVGNNPNIDCDSFLVTLTFKQVRHVEKLMDLDAISASNRGEAFIFYYDLLGKASSLEILINRFDCYSINDKITLSFRASAQSLRLYFQRIFYIPVTLYYLGKAIATIRLNFDKLMPDDSYLDLNQSWTKNGTFFFDQLYKCLSPRTPKPSVSYCFTVQQLSFNGKRGAIDNSEPPLLVPYKSSDIPSIDPKSLNSINSTVNKNDDSSVRDVPSIKTDEDTNPYQNFNFSHTCEIGVQVKIPSEVASKSEEASSELTKKSEINEEELIYNVVQELEEWKKNEMMNFAHKLKEKEVVHLENVRLEWDQERTLLRARLEAKVAQCEELNARLEKANTDLRSNIVQMKDNNNFAEKLKCEIECNYATKFAMLEQQIEHLKTEINQKDALFEIQMKATHIEIQKLEQDKEELEQRIDEMEKEKDGIKVLQQDSEKLKDLLEELRVKTERFNEMEKSKNYYKQKWNKSNRENQQMRVSLMNQQKHDSESTQSEFNDCLESILSDEKESLETDRSELQSIKDTLLNLSSNSEYSESEP